MTKFSCKRTDVILFLALASSLPGQVATTSAGLMNKGLIKVPNWTTSGPTQESTDLSSFNPVTQVLYYADRVNAGAMAIDTTTNSILGWVRPPNCTGACPSGVQVIPDLQKLILTDRKTTLYIYSLDLPGSDPAAVTVPNGTDELDYDPIHHRFYVANTSAPYFLVGIDLVGPTANTVVASIPLPGSPEQARFNPNDGLIYLTVPSVGVVIVDPNAGSAGTGDIVGTYPISNCSPAGNGIDPITNTMLLGCGTVGGQALMNLADGSVLARFPQATATDVMAFDPGTRRWYTGSGNSVNNGGNCPSTNAGTVYPILGVFAAQPIADASKAFVGAECSGRAGSNLAVDPIHHDIFVPVRQYPADPSGPDTGSAGILVFHDPTPAPVTTAHSQATLGSYGTADFAVQGRAMSATAKLQGVADGPTELVVTTTVGNEVVPCFEQDGQAYCIGNLMGDPLMGGMTLLGNGGSVLAKGKIAAAK